MRNEFTEETLIQALTKTLRELLPPAWVVEVVVTSDSPVDATISLRGPRGVLGILDVVVKRWTTAPSSAVTGALAGVQRRTANPLLLMTDYTNRPLRQACEELGINYVDESGWVFLQLDDPPILVRTAGADRAQPRVNNEVTRLNGIAVGRVVRTLLETQPPIGVRELAERASVKSPGSVSKLLPTLVAASAVERDQSGRIAVIKRRALLQRWTQDYSYLNGNGIVLDYLAPRGLTPVLARLPTLSKVCATGAFAGNEYLSAGTVPVVPATRLSLYARDPHEQSPRPNMLLHVEPCSTPWTPCRRTIPALSSSVHRRCTSTPVLRAQTCLRRRRTPTWRWTRTSLLTTPRSLQRCRRPGSCPGSRVTGRTRKESPST